MPNYLFALVGFRLGGIETNKTLNPKPQNLPELCTLSPKPREDEACRGQALGGLGKFGDSWVLVDHLGASKIYCNLDLMLALKAIRAEAFEFSWGELLCYTRNPTVPL